MNHAQAVILSKLTDDEIIALRPEIARRHLPVLREWARVGGDVEWKEKEDPTWQSMCRRNAPTFFDAFDYRIPVRRIEITGPGGTYSYPEPLRVAPEKGTKAYSPSLVGGFHLAMYHHDSDEYLLRAGLLHLTREAAEEHAKALILAGGGTL